MDILYIVGTGSMWSNNELRYSLRSIAQNGINVGRVYVSGYLPEWCQNVQHVPSSDCQQSKHANMLWKIQQAVEQSDIADDFLVSCDDHIYIKPTDFDCYPFFAKDYTNRKCREQLPRKQEHTHSNYISDLIETRKFLEAHDLPFVNFCPHSNIHFNKSIFREMLPLVGESYQTSRGVEPMCLMLNYWLKTRPFDYVVRRDLKFNRIFDNSLFYAKVGERECFSFGDDAICAVEPILRDMFPKKCIYERY